MFKPISSLFKRDQSVWQESDVKYFIQQFLRDKTKSDQVYCQSISGSEVVVRVGSPVLRQEVVLLEFEARSVLQQELGYTLKKIKIVT